MALNARLLTLNVRPLDLPRVDRASLPRSSERDWATFPDDFGDVQIRSVVADGPVSGHSSGMRLLGDDFRLVVDPARLGAFRQALAPLSDDRPLRPEEIDSVVEALLERFLLPRLEAATRASFDFLGTCSDPDSGEGSRAFELRWGELPLRFDVHAGEIGLRFLDDLIARAPLRKNDLRRIIPLTVWAEITRYELSLTTLRSLAPGDTIVSRAAIERARDARDLIVGLTRVWRAHSDGQALTIVAAASKTFEEEDEIMIAPDLDLPEAPDLSEVPVVLQFVAGRLEATVSELETVRAGQVFSMAGREPGVVDMVIGGRKIGRAEMVDIDGAAGFRILEIVGRATAG